MDASLGGDVLRLFLVTVTLFTLTSARFLNNRVRSISPTFSEVGLSHTIFGSL